MTPMPPAWAIAMASRASVTVSMAEETIGMLSEIERVSRVLMSTALGMTSEWPGVSRTSSKVRASLSEPFAIGSANTSLLAAVCRPRRRNRAPIELAAAHSTHVTAGKRKVFVAAQRPQKSIGSC